MDRGADFSRPGINWFNNLDANIFKQYRNQIIVKTNANDANMTSVRQRIPFLRFILFRFIEKFDFVGRNSAIPDHRFVDRSLGTTFQDQARLSWNDCSRLPNRIWWSRFLRLVSIAVLCFEASRRHTLIVLFRQTSKLCDATFHRQ